MPKNTSHNFGHNRKSEQIEELESQSSYFLVSHKHLNIHFQNQNSSKKVTELNKVLNWIARENPISKNDKNKVKNSRTHDQHSRNHTNVNIPSINLTSGDINNDMKVAIRFKQPYELQDLSIPGIIILFYRIG